MKKLFFLLFLIILSCSKEKDENQPVPPVLEEDNTPPPSKIDVLDIINKVNNHWQSTNRHQDASWNNAVYHTGNMAAYEVTKNDIYKNYSIAWADKNEWKGAKSNDKSKWTYHAGVIGDHVLFGDWQTCFQVYIDLYNIDGDEAKIARAKEIMEFQIATSNNDYWWWVDALYMVMPVMTRLYNVTNDTKYLDKLYEYFAYTRDLLYDSDSGLFFRDTKYLYPNHRTISGFKDFWARGNGWAFAALAGILQDLPKNDPHRNEYIRIYQEMAKTLATFQQKEGYWSRSIFDPKQSQGYETSGTAFFTYGFLCGINNEIFDGSYVSTINRGWKYLTNIALQDDGSVGYVQPAGASAVPGQILDGNSTADFGVGAFLLMASEMYKYAK
jgi:rhamnogalacturonyl hydrolase YesR